MNTRTEIPKPMGLVDYGVAWSAMIARSLARLTLRPVRRTRGRVAEEYDAGRWTRIREGESWAGQADLRKFLIDDRTRGATGDLEARVDGLPRRLPVRDYYEYRVEAFAELLGRFISPREELVELGCGYGYNLLSLAITWPQTSFIGFDISPNAVQAAQHIAKHFGLAERMRADVLDATDSSHANFAQLRNRNVLTFFCIEQIPYDVGKVVENLLAQRPRRVVHCEPGTALLKWWKPGDWPDYVYLRSVDYQNDLYAVLRRLEQEGRIRIIEAARMPFAPSLQNTGMLLVWEPV